MTKRRNPLDFSPLRGLAGAISGRASYTIDVNRSILLEGAVRHNGDGAWIKPEYTQAIGQHWRATVGGALIRGQPTDFFGQYRRNQFVTIRIRYSF